jgi:DNA-binding protein HU-beta
MNKSDLITAIVEHANLTKADAGRALDGLTKTIESTLKVAMLTSYLRWEAIS